MYIDLVYESEILLEVSDFSCNINLWGYHWRDEVLMWLRICQIYLWNDLNHNIYGGSWSIPNFVDFFISCFEETVMWAFMGFIKFISWVNDGFMWMVHDIFHIMFESKEGRFCWDIHVSTEAYGEILKTIESLKSDVNESTNPVIEVSSIWFLSLF